MGLKEHDLLSNKRTNNEDSNFSMVSMVSSKAPELTPVTEPGMEAHLSGKQVEDIQIPEIEPNQTSSFPIKPVPVLAQQQFGLP